MERRILIVDDERDICDILRFNLENEGYTVDTASSAEEALTMLTDAHALILLDVMMGGISGFAMADKLRKDHNPIPIIFLTAKNTETDMLAGFSIGGDDYISKPFSIKEVVARVRAILKRAASTQQKEDEPVWTHDQLAIDHQRNRVTVRGVELPLTKKEYEILLLLAQLSPNTVTRAEILAKVWSDNEYVLDRTVDVHITRLRKKLGDYSSLIANRSGFGYYFNTDIKKEE